MSLLLRRRPEISVSIFTLKFHVIRVRSVSVGDTENLPAIVWRRCMLIIDDYTNLSLSLPLPLCLSVWHRLMLTTSPNDIVRLSSLYTVCNVINGPVPWPYRSALQSFVLHVVQSILFSETTMGMRDAAIWQRIRTLVGVTDRFISFVNRALQIGWWVTAGVYALCSLVRIIALL